MNGFIKLMQNRRFLHITREENLQEKKSKPREIINYQERKMNLPVPDF
jgi:hypothetical protein